MSAYSEVELVLQVNQAITLCNRLLADAFMSIEGEVIEYSISRGTFIFFELKDEKEDARIACFAMANQLSTPLENGMRVVVSGKPGLYQKSGKFRISVTRVEAKGEGSVKRAFDLLVKKLEKEGLFARDRKRALPQFPKNVGIISSSEAAGYGDFITIAKQRLPGISFYLVDVAVQGKDAESEIVQAFDYLNGYQHLDAIVLIRGGGSMEDLHAFNSELVARAIVRSKTPVLVGVGHERDITIADYCADVRAATPSNAAQILLPSRQEIEEQVSRLTNEGKRRLDRTIQLYLEQTNNRLQNIANILRYTIERYRNQIGHTLKTIDALSPQRILERGYSITFTEAGDPIITSKSVTPGTAIVTKVFDGEIHSITR